MRELYEDTMGSLYLRALYWASMTMTTVGRDDRVGIDGTDAEVTQAIIVVIIVTLAYVFVVGNANALLLKNHQQVLALIFSITRSCAGLLILTARTILSG